MYHIIHVRILFWILEFSFGHLNQHSGLQVRVDFRICYKALVEDF